MRTEMRHVVPNEKIVPSVQHTVEYGRRLKISGAVQD